MFSHWKWGAFIAASDAIPFFGCSILQSQHAMSFRSVH